MTSSTDRSTVCFRYRRTILLRLDIEAPSHDLKDRLARLSRRLGNVVEEARMICHQRGAILMPPSRRIDSAFRYGVSTMNAASCAYSSALPSRFGNGT